MPAPAPSAVKEGNDEGLLAHHHRSRMDRAGPCDLPSGGRCGNGRWRPRWALGSLLAGLSLVSVVIIVLFDQRAGRQSRYLDVLLSGANNVTGWASRWEDRGLENSLAVPPLATQAGHASSSPLNSSRHAVVGSSKPAELVAGRNGRRAAPISNCSVTRGRRMYSDFADGRWVDKWLLVAADFACYWRHATSAARAVPCARWGGNVVKDTKLTSSIAIKAWRPRGCALIPFSRAAMRRCFGEVRVSSKSTGRSAAASATAATTAAAAKHRRRAVLFVGDSQMRYPVGQLARLWGWNGPVSHLQPGVGAGLSMEWLAGPNDEDGVGPRAIADHIQSGRFRKVVVGMGAWDVSQNDRAAAERPFSTPQAWANKLAAVLKRLREAARAAPEEVSLSWVALQTLLPPPAECDPGAHGGAGPPSEAVQCDAFGENERRLANATRENAAWFRRTGAALAAAQGFRVLDGHVRPTASQTAQRDRLDTMHFGRNTTHMIARMLLQDACADLGEDS